MIVKVVNSDSVEIDDNVVKLVLDLYPEENLAGYATFKDAFQKNSITIKDLKEVSEKIHIPWQMFFLEEDVVKKELKNIESNRADKFPKNIVAISKRAARGKITSRRIIDRQIRIQNFVCSQLPEEFNCDFIGILKGQKIEDAIQIIINYFNIDLDSFRTKTNIEDSLIYLTKRIQSKGNINISQGVLTNSILPEIKNIRKIYKSTSGFVLKSDKMPFIFLPNEINPDENNYRQVFTLLYLLVVVGLDEYSHSIEEKFSFKKLKEDVNYFKINKIVSDLLLPIIFTDTLKDKEIDRNLINKIKGEYKLSYSAILFILRFRKLIKTKEEYEALKLPEKESSPITQIAQYFNKPHISTSVEKFCGVLSYKVINDSIKNKTLFPIQAQLLTFGRVKKASYKKYLLQI